LHTQPTMSASPYVLDRPVPPMKPRNPKVFGGSKYFIKATTKIRVEQVSKSKPIGMTWGASQFISIIQRVEEAARREAASRYETFDVDPPEVVFIFEDNVEHPDVIFTKFEEFSS
jgi:hypothetical protein